MSKEYVMSRYASDLEELRDAVAEAAAAADSKGFLAGDVGTLSVRVGLEVTRHRDGTSTAVLILDRGGVSYQLYKQGPGALDIDDKPMEPGWYWVRTRGAADMLAAPIPFGRSTGPFNTKREAQRHFRRRA